MAGKCPNCGHWTYDGCTCEICGVYLMIRPRLGCEFSLAFDEAPLLNPNIAHQIYENPDDKDRIIREELLRLVEESKSK